MKKYIGTKVKQSRIDSGLTQEQMAEHLNMTRRTVGSIENGDVDVRMTVLASIAKTTNRCISWFLPTDNEGNNNAPSC